MRSPPSGSTVGGVDDGVRRSAATWCLLALVAGLTALPVVSVTRSALVATGVLDLAPGTAAGSRAGLVGVYGEDALRNAEGFAAVLVTGPAAVVGLLVLVGLVLWRAWAREAALALFGLLGGLLCVVAVAGLAGDARNAGAGLAVGVLMLGTAGLAMSPPVCADFDRWRIAGEARERRRLEQQRRERSPGG